MPEEVQETGVVQPFAPPEILQEGGEEKVAVAATQEFDAMVQTPFKHE